jgi:glyceraldehyde-3-phosphate dehydrogenase/erythrose-4-phosphate dehydrogenase
MIKIAINGFGRIGRNIVRALYGHQSRPPPFVPSPPES